MVAALAAVCGFAEPLTTAQPAQMPLAYIRHRKDKKRQGVGPRTVSGWQRAHHWSAETLGGRLPVERLLEDAIQYAKRGMP
ncbi:gamma-glutamyltranspeptidase [Paraburkholderia sp. WSM4179]|nr:gamma-glutamyltranspeptidase [Paraburkholderia sp. WSM4179]